MKNKKCVPGALTYASGTHFFIRISIFGDRESKQGCNDKHANQNAKEKKQYKNSRFIDFHHNLHR